MGIFAVTKKTIWRRQIDYPDGNLYSDYIRTYLGSTTIVKIITIHSSLLISYASITSLVEQSLNQVSS